MKTRINFCFMMFFAVVFSALGLTSCNKSDQYLSDLLRNRDWQGYIGTYYYDRWGVTGDEYRTVMRFTSNDSWATSGRGEELDYSLSHRNSYAYSTFKWFIVDGELTLLYDDQRWDPYYIVDYTLTSTLFRGYIYDGTNRNVRFSLENSTFNDWSYYRGRTGLYWSRRPMTFDGDHTENTEEEPFIDRTPYCQGDDGQGRSILSGEFAKAFMEAHPDE